MELLTAEIFRLLRNEGYELGSMGLAPLAKLDDPDLRPYPRLTRLMRFAYERVEGAYDFKQLYRYKAKYHPHAWERRYLCSDRRRYHPGCCMQLSRSAMRFRYVTFLNENSAKHLRESRY